MFLVCFGTRPEYIKVKSFIDNIKNVKTCFTGQHVDLLKNIDFDYSLTIQNETDNRLNNILINILKNGYIFDNIKYAIVQGDTTTAMAVAISAVHHNIKVIHLEAGLRTYNVEDPYPEEMNRQLISRLAYMHLCPTEKNKINLLTENITSNIFVTGNTGLDNIDKEDISYTNKVVITLHRRNNHNMIKQWFTTIEKIANKYNDTEFILPIHPNPNVKQHKDLFKKVCVVEPLSHNEMIKLVKSCRLIISDSGGIQEEASYLNKKIIICREDTERPEVLDSGHGILCPKPEFLEDIFARVYEDFYINSYCPFGDGYSHKRIKTILESLE
jgi:UDP-N-acetylglucosamine 2-epimerase (non-hydrolysing)